MHDTESIWSLNWRAIVFIVDRNDVWVKIINMKKLMRVVNNLYYIRNHELFISTFNCCFSGLINRRTITDKIKSWLKERALELCFFCINAQTHFQWAGLNVLIRNNPNYRSKFWCCSRRSNPASSACEVEAIAMSNQEPGLKCYLAYIYTLKLYRKQANSRFKKPIEINLYLDFMTWQDSFKVPSGKETYPDPGSCFLFVIRPETVI